MNREAVILTLTLASLVLSVAALTKQSFHPFYLKIEVQYGHIDK